jgi:hypothetical protein
LGVAHTPTRPYADPPTRFPHVAGQGSAGSPGSDGASPYLSGHHFLGERSSADPPHADLFPLKSKVCQPGMIQWARERSIPVKFAFGFFDWQIVNGGVPMMH